MTRRLIELKTHPLGSIEAVYAGYRPADAWFIEDGAVAYEIEPVVEVFGRDVGLDLIGPRDGGVAPWVLKEGPKGARFALDLDPASGMDAEIHRLELPKKSRRGAVVAHRDPLTAERTTVQPEARYHCEVMAGLNGLAADLMILVYDEEGRHIDSVRRQLSDRFAGGREASGFERVQIDFETPKEAVSLEISVLVKPGEGEGVLCLGRPSLARRSRRASGPWPIRRLARSELESLALVDRSADLARVRLPLPARLLDGAPRDLVLRVRTEDGELAAPVRFQKSVDFALSKRGVERASVVRLAGRAPDALEAVNLEVRIDGRLSSTSRIKIKGGKFDARLPIGDAHLDGRPHLIEAREADSQAVLWSTHQRTAAYHARWPVLQTYAQAPLSAESSPALDRHRRALEAWSRRKGPKPDIAWLHGQVLAGVNKRPSYPPLAFTQPARPVATVVVPAHNKFEVTYLCLCALLFAAVDTPFEVIVVDDGSNDDTARLEDIVSGVRVIRHETARGFIAGCRAGAEAARGDYIAFLNNDTEVAAGWLDELVHAFERFDRVGLTGAKLVYPDGRLQEAGGVVWGSGDPWNAGRGGEPDDPSWTYAREVDYLSGAAILTSRAVWDELGGFDEAYAPAYFEDTDFAMKVRASGRRVVYVPTAEVYHFEGMSSGVIKTEGTKRFQEINRPKFKQRWKALYAGRRAVGDRVDLEKDRGAAFRVLWFAAPPAAASDEAETLRALQAAGAKITLLPPDLRYRPRFESLRRDGVECLHAPWVSDPVAWTAVHAGDFDLLGPDSAETAALAATLTVPPPIGRFTGRFNAFEDRLAAVRAELARHDLYGFAQTGLHPVTPPAAAAPAPTRKAARAAPSGPPAAKPRRRA